jgi:hypothetical protein
MTDARCQYVRRISLSVIVPGMARFPSAMRTRGGWRAAGRSLTSGSASVYFASMQSRNDKTLLRPVSKPGARAVQPLSGGYIRA